jgi:FMN-dependent NADH-azoreductase
MTKVLVVNGSPRGNRSHSRRLVQVFVEHYRQLSPCATFKYREIGQGNIPHIAEDWIAAAFTKEENRTPEMKVVLKLSDELIDELIWADVIVAGVPMYNWSVPSSFKAYIDQIMRIDRTWKFASGEPDGVYQGLLLNKEMYLISSRGDFGYEKGGHNQHMNFQSNYLKTVLGIMGIADVKEVILENEEFGGESFQNSLLKAENRIKELASKVNKVSYCLTV